MQLTVLRSRPGRRRGIADSDSEDSRSVVSSSDSELRHSESEPPAKKKSEVMQHCNVLGLEFFLSLHAEMLENLYFFF